MMKIDDKLLVSTSHFLRKDNTSLVKLLKAVSEAGSSDNEGISTRMLCASSGLGRSYGLKVIARASKEGYITRTGKDNTSGGGKARVVKLTKKGRMLLKKLDSGE
jgi:DNA-binding MarR family transcriptional regulator